MRPKFGFGGTRVSTLPQCIRVGYFFDGVSSFWGPKIRPQTPKLGMGYGAPLQTPPLPLGASRLRASFGPSIIVSVYLCLHGCALGYLASDLQRVSDLGTRRRLRSSTTSALVAPRTYRACYHRRSSLPGGCCICLERSAGHSTLIAVIASFPQYRLKTELFARFYSCSD